MTPRTSRIVDIVRWLRAHPDVLSGPSVRGAIAFEGVAASWQLLAARDDLLRAALVALPHRLTVLAGVDPDELVRQAVDAVTDDAAPSGAGEAPPDQDDAAAVSRPRRDGPPLDVVAAVRTPSLADAEGPAAPVSVPRASRLLDRLLTGAPAPRSSAGVRSLAPDGDRPGEEVLAPRPYRSGDRRRDVSTRHTVRTAILEGGRLDAGSLQSVTRLPTARFDVVLALDASASMLTDDRFTLARGLCRTFAETLVRQGHLVALVVFADQPVVVSGLTRDLSRLLHARVAYQPTDPTNLESAIAESHRLLLREGDRSSARRVLLVTDAEPTSHTGGAKTKRAAGSAGRTAGLYGVGAARYAALRAARRCLVDGVSVSVVCPGGSSNVRFAAAVAAAGGGAFQSLALERPAASG